MNDILSIFLSFLICGSIFGLVWLGWFLQDQHFNSMQNEIRQESIKDNTIFVDNFKTLSDCTEMTLQLTEKRFYNNTFKDEAWNHYRGLC